ANIFEGNTAIGVGLGIEEGLGMHDVLLFALLQVGPGQVVEILLGTQYIGTAVVQIEKFLEIAEGIGATQGIDIAPGQRDLVALGQAEQQFGLQRAFEVQVQLGLG